MSTAADINTARRELRKAASQLLKSGYRAASRDRKALLKGAAQFGAIYLVVAGAMVYHGDVLELGLLTVFLGAALFQVFVRGPRNLAASLRRLRTVVATLPPETVETLLGELAPSERRVILPELLAPAEGPAGSRETGPPGDGGP